MSPGFNARSNAAVNRRFVALAQSLRCVPLTLLVLLGCEGMATSGWDVLRLAPTVLPLPSGPAKTGVSTKRCEQGQPQHLLATIVVWPDSDAEELEDDEDERSDALPAALAFSVNDLTVSTLRVDRGANHRCFTRGPAQPRGPPACRA